MKKQISNFTSTKLWLTFYVLTAIIALTFNKRIDSKDCIYGLLGGLAIYAGANVWQKKIVKPDTEPEEIKQ